MKKTFKAVLSVIVLTLIVGGIALVAPIQADASPNVKSSVSTVKANAQSSVSVKKEQPMLVSALFERTAENTILENVASTKTYVITNKAMKSYANMAGSGIPVRENQFYVYLQDATDKTNTRVIQVDEAFATALETNKATTITLYTTTDNQLFVEEGNVLARVFEEIAK